MLPEQFLKRMERMLGEEFEDFLTAYDRSKSPSLRLNAGKGEQEHLLERAGFSLRHVPWAEEGRYYKEEERPGKHPYHAAGLYYIQEASAMAPVKALDPRPGEVVLDLCAAPGGKSTQIGTAMQGKGLLISNEPHPVRAKTLSENMERMGIKNSLVVSHEPEVLAERFPQYFDKILVDAPCSGEGMFRKSEEALTGWSLENIKLCADRQDRILASAACMLKPGGRLVYSTCTFAPEENEGTVSRFLACHSDFYAGEINICDGMESGQAGFLEGTLQKHIADEIKKTVRLWPHKLEGEGHFMALLIRQNKEEDFMEEEPLPERGSFRGVICEKGLSKKELTEWKVFEKQYLNIQLSGLFISFGEQLYLAPEIMPALKGLKVLRSGLHLGTMKKGRFEPSHALALALCPGEAVNCLNLSLTEAERYLKGETLPAQGEKGWYLITVDECSIGWGKLSGGVMKNHYPKGLRR